MKRYLIVWLGCCICMICPARSVVHIQGRTALKEINEVNVYTFRQGVVSLLTGTKVEQNGEFRLTVHPEYEGFYLLGKNERVLYPLYLKGGEQLRVQLQENRLTLEGEQTPENKALYQWEDQAADVRYHAYLYDRIRGGRSVECAVFFDEWAKLAAHRMNLSSGLFLENARFNALLKRKMETDLDFYALAYYRNCRGRIPDSVSLPVCYQEIQARTIFQRPEILEIPFAGDMLDVYVWCRCKTDSLFKPGLGQETAYLEKKALQQVYLLTKACGFKYYDQYQEMLDCFGKDFFPRMFKAPLQEVEKKLGWSEPGVQAPDFKAMGQDSVWRSLSDFREKVVVVDVWATWCEPCKRMMPYFQQLEKELEREDVVFLSICMGASVERETWLRIIEKEQLKGNLFFIGAWRGDFAKNYRITGVPRFMVFDREGQIVSVAAPYPSDSRLKDLIRKTIEGKRRL